jgi:PAS domain S-box-containing protein
MTRISAKTDHYQLLLSRISRYLCPYHNLLKSLRLTLDILDTMEGKESLDALFLFATEGILVVNEKGEIVRINPSAEKLFGYGKDELKGQKIEVLVPSRLSERHKNHREKYSGTPHARSMGAGFDLHGVKKDGTEFPVEVSLSPYTSPEGKFVIGFVVDITVRKQAEEKLKNYSEELARQVKNRTLILEEAIDELEKTKKDLHNALEKERELSELKSRFVSMASHEFRTPLTTILSSLSLVSKYGETGDRENQSRHITKIKSSINSLTDILNDFLSVSKLEEGRVEYMPEEMNLKSFTADIITEMRPVVRAAQHLLFSFEGNEIVSLDPKILRHILFNLISNAIKFSPGGGNVEVSISVGDRAVRISVKDSGIGIPEEDQRHLFERFFRGHNATHIQGTGLGLNIVARYVEFMNGTLAFESAENKGTTFTLTIPQ